jgi:hypothetical protein
MSTAQPINYMDAMHPGNLTPHRERNCLLRCGGVALYSLKRSTKNLHPKD